MKNIRIAFGHKARTGKDTAVEHIKDVYGAHVVRFAGPIYEIATQIQNICITLYTGPILVTIERIYSAINEVIKEPSHEHSIKNWIDRILIPKILQEGGVKEKKVPWLLQLIGTDLKNIIGYNLWVNMIQYKISAILTTDPEANICCPDVRFPNEYDMLETAGFVLVRVNRENRPIDRDPNHPSEIALDKHIFHYTIDNNGTIKEYTAAIDSLLQKIYM